MTRQPKYKRGRRIKTIAALVREIIGGRYVYWHHKPQHPGWIGSMRLCTLRGAVRRGVLWYAKENQ